MVVLRIALRTRTMVFLLLHPSVRTSFNRLANWIAGSWPPLGGTWCLLAPNGTYLQRAALKHLEPGFLGFFIALRQLLNYLAYWCGNLLLRFLLNICCAFC